MEKALSQDIINHFTNQTNPSSVINVTNHIHQIQCLTFTYTASTKDQNVKSAVSPLLVHLTLTSIINWIITWSNQTLPLSNVKFVTNTLHKGQSFLDTNVPNTRVLNFVVQSVLLKPKEKSYYRSILSAIQIGPRVRESKSSVANALTQVHQTGM